MGFKHNVFASLRDGVQAWGLLSRRVNAHTQHEHMFKLAPSSAGSTGSSSGISKSIASCQQFQPSIKNQTVCRTLASNSVQTHPPCEAVLKMHCPPETMKSTKNNKQPAAVLGRDMFRFKTICCLAKRWIQTKARV